MNENLKLAGARRFQITFKHQSEKNLTTVASLNCS